MYRNSSVVLAFLVCSGLAACASTQKAAMHSASLTSPQLSLASQNASDAPMRAGLPTPQSADAAGACALIPPAEQNECPIQQNAVIGARQLRAPRDPKGNSSSPAGAEVYIVATPGLTKEWLGHLAECYQARVAEAGNALQARESCPLAELESSYSIASTQDGFALKIRSSQSEAAQRIFEVSKRLSPSQAPHWGALAVRP